MDITDISKVASRKRMNTDAEKLREKVARETAKIIKLKVAQDTAYWDLKERLQQLEGAHERLQQNMVDVQMQHEAASAHYTEELRLRPDTLNKVSGTRGTCGVLEEYAARLRRGVARCRADRAALAAAYAAAGARVRRLAADAQRHRDQARRTGERQEAEARRLADTLQQLGAARAREHEHAAARADLAARLQRAEEAAAAMRDDVSRLMTQFDAQSADMKRTIARQHNEVQEGARALQAARGESDERAADLRRLRHQLQEATNTIDLLHNEATEYVRRIENLEKVINDKIQRQNDLEAEVGTMKQYLSKLEEEKLEVIEQLNQSAQQYRAKSATADEMSAAVAELQRRHEQQAAASAELQRRHEQQAAASAELQRRLDEHVAASAELQRRLDETAAARADLQRRLDHERAAAACQRDADAARLEQLRSAADAKDRELDANTGTIAHLMGELKAEAEARGRADAALAAARRQADAERDAARDAAARNDAALQAKEQELSAQIAIILDMRNEKARLQERIEGMQNTIDNIQKELTGRLGRASAAAADPPEHDGSASLYSFLSDGSLDGDALDPQEVRRRFQALERGCGGSGGGGGGRAAAASRAPAARLRAQGTISLSQVKDDLNMKSRAFFKNKRFDNKSKKLK